MRVLFVTTGKHVPELHGGMEVNTHQLALQLLLRGVPVGVLCGLAGTGLVGLRARVRRRILADSCPVDHGLGYPTWRSYEPIDHVARVAASFRPDRVVLQGAADFMPLLAACLALDVPILCYLHSSDLLPLPPDILALERLRFLANSRFTQSLHPGKHFLGVLPPIIPPEQYRTATDRSHAVLVNPAPYKGLDIALALARARSDVPFLLVRTRKPIAIDQSRASLWNGMPNISVTGPLGDMRHVYRRARLVLAPSRVSETWGRVASEAHVSGIPVLASDRGGLPESVGPGGTCLSPDAPIADWLAAFSAIWDEPQHYGELSQAALDYSRRAEMDRDHIVEAFLAALRSEPIARE